MEGRKLKHYDIAHYLPKIIANHLLLQGGELLKFVDRKK